MKRSRARTVSGCTGDRHHWPPSPFLSMSPAIACGVLGGNTTMRRLSQIKVLGPLGGFPEAMDWLRR